MVHRSVLRMMQEGLSAMQQMLPTAARSQFVQHQQKIDQMAGLLESAES